MQQSHFSVTSANAKRSFETFIVLMISYREKISLIN